MPRSLINNADFEEVTLFGSNVKEMIYANERHKIFDEQKISLEYSNKLEALGLKWQCRYEYDITEWFLQQRAILIEQRFIAHSYKYKQIHTQISNVYEMELLNSKEYIETQINKNVDVAFNKLVNTIQTTGEMNKNLRVYPGSLRYR